MSNPIYSYIGMLVAVVAIVSGVLFPEYSATLWAIAGFFGFGSVGLLRQKIDAEGWKTYAIVIVVGVMSVLQIAGIITPETYELMIAAFAPLTGITLQQALAKSTSSVPEIK